MFKRRPYLQRWILPRSRAYLCLALITVFLTVLCNGIIFPVRAIVPAPTSVNPAPISQIVSQTQNQNLNERGKTLYEAGQFAAAVEALQQAINSYRQQGNTLAEAAAWSNLSLVYQQLGQWNEAETAIATSLQLLEATEPIAPTPPHTLTLAQVYEIQGRLQLARGQAETALDTWKRTADLYQSVASEAGIAGVIRSGINQAEALQMMGLYRRAIDTLEQVSQSLEAQPISTLQVVVLRSLGDAFRGAGDLTRAEANLRQSLSIAQQLQQSDAITATQLSLANVLYAQGQPEAALPLYQQAATSSHPPTQLQAKLNQLRLLIQTDRVSSVPDLITDLITQLDRLPPSRMTTFARINLVRSVIQWGDRRGEGRGQEVSVVEPVEARNRSMPPSGGEMLLSPIQIAQMLGTAQQHAQILQDTRAEAFALGTLGELYEQTKQFSEAQQVTESALNLAQAMNALDMTYLWQWQLGRVWQEQKLRDQAIAAYADAVTTLRSLRSDLVAINPEVQFSFREGVEPVYRQFVSLLLQPGVNVTDDELELARRTIESLQLAELDNFFREACLNAEPVLIDQVDEQAAVFYPIILPDRLEIILTLPEGGTRRYSVSVSEDQVNRTVTQMQQFLRQLASNDRATELSEQVYEWLIRPAADDLSHSHAKTLVFVLDGVLRNIPMAVLRDRDTQQYLIQQYAIALTPGLQLLSSQPFTNRQFGVLLGGLSESPSPEFSDLPGVVGELEKIRTEVSNHRILLNDQFKDHAIRDAIEAVPFPIVHLATHGEFSSRLEETFILTWDNRITINQLNSLLQATDIRRRRPIELLVLSACETAEGDDRAALGLAGVAVRAGARSTVATLWLLNDAVAPSLMVKFYETLESENTTKAEALRQAQLSLLQDPQFSQPYYWGALVLVGNWL